MSEKNEKKIEYTDEEKKIVERAQKIFDFSCGCVFRMLRQDPEFTDDPIGAIFAICQNLR